MASGYAGSNGILTSTANTEIVNPENLGLNKLSFKKFSFLNKNNCTVKINGSDPIFLEAGQGFASDESDPPIKSFIIIEEGIQYNWIGSY